MLCRKRELIIYVMYCRMDFSWCPKENENFIWYVAGRVDIVRMYVRSVTEGIDFYVESKRELTLYAVIFFSFFLSL